MAKHVRLGPILEVDWLKKCAVFWREAHLEVESGKTHRFRTTFGSWHVKKMHAIVATTATTIIDTLTEYPSEKQMDKTTNSLKNKMPNKLTT